MLPPSLAGSYQQYKEDTTVFTTWLAKTAIACGYKMPSQTLAESSVLSETVNSIPIKRRKGKAREVPVDSSNEATESRQSVTYTVSTRELVKQAEVVAENRKRGIPQRLKRVVKRAIDVRQRCADWYKLSEVTNAYSDDGKLRSHRASDTKTELIRSSILHRRLKDSAIYSRARQP